MTTTPQLDQLGNAARDIADKGWRPVWMHYNNAGKLVPVPRGTGYDRIDLARPHDAVMVVVGCPDNGAMIDVDQYLKEGKQKTGADQLKAMAAKLGPLPPTWKITSRGPEDPGGKLLFRVPEDLKLYSKIRLRGTPAMESDIESIQRHIRWTWAPGTEHPTTHTPVMVYGPDGMPGWLLPHISEVPLFPVPWAEECADTGERATNMGTPEYPDNDGRCPLAVAWLEHADFTGADARGDRARDAACYLKRMDFEGCKVGGLIDEVIAALPNTSSDVFEDLWTSATIKPGAVYLGRDCCNPWVLPPAPVAPQNGNGQVTPMSIQAVTPVTTPEVIPEDINNRLGVSDQENARMVLDVSLPILRYAEDADTWLVYRGEKWETSKLAAETFIARMRPRMPRGDPKGNEIEVAQAARKVKFGETKGSRNATGKMKAMACGSAHAVRLGDLDQQPEILWAGGYPYDLRASGAAGYPVVSQLDPGTPHLHHARFVPDIRVPTPLWDRFLEAVWPWEDLRAWALRVLSVGVTGYSAKCLPIFLGDTDHGKTTVVKLIADVLGTYALGAADPRLLASSERAHASIVYELKGRRLTLIDEAPRTGGMAQEQLKRMTGGAALTGNRMGENPVAFAPTHTLVLTANPEHEPKLTDSAVARRVRLIPCDGDAAAVVAACKAIDTDNLAGSAVWKAEGPGVLAKMMVEAGLFLADQSTAGNGASPDGVKELVASIVREQCQVQSWIEARCEPWPAGTRASYLYEQFTDYVKWHTPRDEPYSVKKWGLLLNKEYPAIRHADGNYRPLRLRVEYPGASGFGR